MSNPAKGLPGVEQLCDHLGYNGLIHGRRQYDLNASTKKFRETYKSSDGTLGEDVRYWTPETGNLELKEMARAFLESGYGEQHWPEGDDGDTLPLQYPRDTERLIDLLHKLIFRQNSNAYHNRNIIARNKAKRAQKDITHESSSLNDSFSSPFASQDTPPNYGGSQGDHSDSGDSTKIRSNKRRRSSRARKEHVAYVAPDTDEDIEYQDMHPSLFQQVFANSYSLGRVATQAQMPEVKSELIESPSEEQKRPVSLAVSGMKECIEPFAPRKTLVGKRNISGHLGSQHESDRMGFTPVNGSNAPIRSDERWTMHSKDSPLALHSNLPSQQEADRHTANHPGLSPHERHASQMSDLESEKTRRSESQQQDTRSLERMQHLQTGTNGVSESHTTEEKLELRACQRCNSRHTRCDKRKPICSFCKANGHKCIYPTSSNSASLPAAQQSRTLASHLHRPSDVANNNNLTSPNEHHTGSSNSKQFPAPTVCAIDPNTLSKTQLQYPFIQNPPRAPPTPPTFATSIRNTPLDHTHQISPPASVPSQSSSSVSNRPSQIPQPTPKPKPKSKAYDIRYFILSSSRSHPHESIEQRWSGGKKLSDYALPAFIDEISRDSSTPANDILSIKFNLSSPQAGQVRFTGSAYTVARNDEDLFDEMREEFVDRIKEGMKGGVSKFRILMELVVDQRAGGGGLAGAQAVGGGVEEDDSDVEVVM